MGGIRIVEAVCPDCGVLHQAIVDAEFGKRKETWRRSGHLVIFCRSCREKRKKKGGNNDGCNG